MFSSGANASISIEDLYKNCKPFQNNGFSFKNLSPSKRQKGLHCFSYLAGLRDKGNASCIFINEMNKDKDLDKINLELFSSLFANGDASINPLITSFINFAENNTDKWKQSVWVFSSEFIGKKFPCKIE